MTYYSSSAILDADEQFPELTATAETRGLQAFTGSTFHAQQAADDIKARVRQILEVEYGSFPNVQFVTDTAGLDFWYTWGIDDTAVVFPIGRPDVDFPTEFLPIDPFAPCPDWASEGCGRLIGKARGADPSALYPNPTNSINEVSIVNPTYARTWAGSMTLPNGSASPSDPPLVLGGDLDSALAPNGVEPEHVARAIANSATHEIAHLFGARHDCLGDPLEHMCQRTEREEAIYDKRFTSPDVLNSLATTLTTAATADQFEVNDSFFDATPVGVGAYDNLTLDTALDIDWYRIDVTEDHSDLRIVWTFNRSHYGGEDENGQYSVYEKILLEEWANVLGEEHFCIQGTCATSLVAPVRGNDGDSYIVERNNLMAGTTFHFQVYQFRPRVPLPYKMNVTGSFAGGDPIFELPPDSYEDNDTPETAWPLFEGTNSFCDFQDTINLQSDTDVDYYAMQADGSSVRVELFFDPNDPPNRRLDLFLDGVQATESSLSEDGTEKLEITGCGTSPSLAKVSGDRGFYNMCLSIIPLEASCIPFNDTDMDGIADEIDTDPQNYSNEFSDGTTYGIIITRGEQNLTITDAPALIGGVVIRADGQGGIDKAIVSVCDNRALYSFNAGDEETVTCGSVVTEVTNGLVDITFAGNNGLTASTALPAINALIFDETLFTLSAPSSNNDSVIVEFAGKIETVNPGDMVNLECINDTAPPSITLSVTPDILWPPNHKLVPITTTVSATDNCDPKPNVGLLTITTNEGDETDTYDPSYDASTGDGNTVNDIVADNGNLALRAERKGGGNGRVYTITYEATDASGNHSTASATVTVPHN